MSQPHNLSEALNFALKQDWWIFVLIILIPFEKWFKKKFDKKGSL